MATEAEVTECIGSGEILFVAYHGGSKPGSTREIVPLQITAANKVRARCYTSNRVKTFLISKIEILERKKDEEIQVNWSNQIAARDIPAPERASEIATDFHDNWREVGWLVQFFDDCNNKSFGIGVHRRKKRTKGHMKHPTHSLQYRPYVIEGIFIDFENAEMSEYELTHKATKPWLMNGKSYVYYGHALGAFIEAVNSDKP